MLKNEEINTSIQIKWKRFLMKGKVFMAESFLSFLLDSSYSSDTYRKLLNSNNAWWGALDW